MKTLLYTLILMIPFGLLSQQIVVEPELVSDEFTISGDWGNYIYQRYIFKNKIYFYADDGVHGSELWVTDGTTNGTFLLKDITPDGNSNIFIIKADLENLIFAVKDDTGKSSLWATDGTKDGTGLLANINAMFGNGLHLYDFEYQEHNGKIIFQADDGIHGSEPWITDGTVSGTYMIQDLGVDGGSDPFYFAIAGNQFVFSTSENVGFKSVIWSTDGSKNSCQNIYQGNGNARIEDIGLEGLSLIITNSHDPITNKGYTAMSITDGTPGGTFPILGQDKDLGGIPTKYTKFKNKIYFTFFNGWSNRLYSTDGTKEGTLVEFELADAIEGITIWDDKLVISSTYAGLYITGGTAKDTIPISALIDDSVYYSQYSVDDDVLYLIGADKNQDRALWKTDGTKEGTIKVKDIITYPDNLTIQFMKSFDGNKMFSTFKNPEAEKLWVTDGTEEGTKQTADFTVLPNFNRYGFRLVEQFGDYLSVVTNSHNKENYLFLMKRNLEAFRIEPLNSTRLNKFALQTGLEIIGEIDGYLYFVANYYDTGEQLWKIKVEGAITSVEEDEPQNLLTLYPNPAEDYIQIEIGKPMQLTIISNTGAVVKDCGLVTDGKVEVSELSTGVYFIVDEQGNNIAKFVKE